MDEIQNVDKDNNDCCWDQNIKNIEGQLTCVNCGQVVGEDLKSEYINFRQNIFKIYKKTVYNRKYHLSHALDQSILKNKVEISGSTNFKIHKIFVEINKILPQINGRRKRTMKLYNFYRNNIMDIIATKIMHIINQT